MDYRSLCFDVIELSREIGLFIKIEEQNISNKHIEVKSLNSLVSYVDKTAEEKIIDRLSKLLPEAGFIAEEGTSTKVGKKYNWIIDPLDGTTNFLHKIPTYSVSIALKKEDEIVLGVVYEINRDECFYAWQGSKAFLNQKEIHCSTNTQLADALIATGFPYFDFDKSDTYFELMKSLIKECRSIRRIGSAAVDLAYVACGRFDSFFEYSLNPWDVAAGAFIVQQAGGSISDFSGTNNWLFDKEIIASSKAIHPIMVEKCKQYFGGIN